MLKYFSCSVIELKLKEFSTKVEKFCKLLAEFPLVESLELGNITLEGPKLSLDKLPKFLHLRNLKINGGWYFGVDGVLPLLGCAENIRSLSLKYAKMEVKELNHFLNQQNNSLEFLSFKSCKLIPDPLDSIFDCFDSLHQLHKLRLLHSDEVTKRVLTSKSIYELTDFEVKYNFSHKDQVTSFLRNYFKLKEINDLQLTEYEATKEPIITNIKSPNSENIITTFYHFHHCTSNSFNCYDHNKCKTIPLMDSELDWIQNKNFKAFLLIQVRDNTAKMSKEVAENPPIKIIIASSFNTTINNSGESNNNIYNVTNIFNGINKEDVMKEETLEFIWKYLSCQDKFNCTLVCKRFNNFISSMNCYWLNNFWTKKDIPILSRDYQKVYIYNYDFNYLDQRMVQFLKHLGRNVTNLKISNIKVDLMTFSEILHEFPLLESLELDGIELEDEELCLEDLPNLLHLDNLTINMSHGELKRVLSIFGCALKIRTLSLSFSKMNLSELNLFLNQHRNSLESLRLRCVNTSSELDFNSFNHLHQLRKLRLSYSHHLIENISSFKCIHWLKDLVVKYHSSDKEKVNLFLQNYFKLKEINEDQLIKYDACKEPKEPIMTKIKCPNTGIMITTYYHIHHCDENRYHKNCRPILLKQLELSRIHSLIRNLKLNPIRYHYYFLSILVRENPEDFKKSKGIIKYDYDSN
ncbi:unnamed protein product [Diamesa hyperborea]